ncbi:hypothetical protein IP91_02709 [Pseudoduganella lurida]|uniref:DUF883 domain-containing protein n=1 Tax=Pseudoduganella lurida TaxID=1036180 RepID=A0A562R8B2_9BURK|nr:hypothetical protein [Pseudoduganella lurida]TWI65301.1 hypothetical protein IP91_02709 [Pseudoduganella lurida]
MEHQEPTQQGGQLSSNAPSQQRLIGDLRQVIDNAEDLLKSTDGCLAGAHQSARAKLAEALDLANRELERFEEAQVSRMIAATREANARHCDSTGEARVLRAFH